MAFVIPATQRPISKWAMHHMPALPTWKANVRFATTVIMKTDIVNSAIVPQKIRYRVLTANVIRAIMLCPLMLAGIRIDATYA